MRIPLKFQWEIHSKCQYLSSYSSATPRHYTLFSPLDLFYLMKAIILSVMNIISFAACSNIRCLSRYFKYPRALSFAQISARSLLRSNIRALSRSLKYPLSFPFTHISAPFSLIQISAFSVLPSNISSLPRLQNMR